MANLESSLLKVACRQRLRRSPESPSLVAEKLRDPLPADAMLASEVRVAAALERGLQQRRPLLARPLTAHRPLSRRP